MLLETTKMRSAKWRLLTKRWRGSASSSKASARDDKDAKRQMEAIDKTMERERFEFKGKCLSLKEAMYQQDTLQKEQAKLQESLRLSAQQSQRDKTKKSD